MSEATPNRALPVALLGLLVAASVAVVALMWPTSTPLVSDEAAETAPEAVVEPAGERQAPRVTRDPQAPTADESAAMHQPPIALPTHFPRLELPPVEPDYGRLETAGELPKEAGAAAISALYPHAMMCLIEARKTDPTVGSRITLRLLVVPGPDGRSRLADLDAVDKGKTSKPLRDCLRKAAGGVALALGPEVRGTVTAPMVLGKDPDQPPPGAMMPMQQAGHAQGASDDDSEPQAPEPGLDEHGVEIDPDDPEPARPEPEPTRPEAGDYPPQDPHHQAH